MDVRIKAAAAALVVLTAGPAWIKGQHPNNDWGTAWATAPAAAVGGAEAVSDPVALRVPPVVTFWSPSPAWPRSRPGRTASPSRVAPVYDSGDHLHPNDAGDLAMADAVPLNGL